MESTHSPNTNSRENVNEAFNEKGGFSFSVPLKKRLITYFRDRHNVEMNDEQAELFLRSLARIGDALSRDVRLDSSRLKEE